MKEKEELRRALEEQQEQEEETHQLRVHNQELQQQVAYRYTEGAGSKL